MRKELLDVVNSLRNPRKTRLEVMTHVGFTPIVLREKIAENAKGFCTLRRALRDYFADFA
jgi:hypothetical protein